MNKFEIGGFVIIMVAGMINGMVKNDDLYKRDDYVAVQQVSEEVKEEIKRAEAIEKRIEKMEQEEIERRLEEEEKPFVVEEKNINIKQFNQLKKVHEELESLDELAHDKTNHVGFTHDKEAYILMIKKELKEELADMEVEGLALYEYKCALEEECIPVAVIILEDAIEIRDAIENVIQ